MRGRIAIMSTITPTITPTLTPTLTLTRVLLLAALLLPGCVQRTIHITSEPSGALVWVNDREVGRTPVDVDFVHYGTYDVRLVKPQHEPLLTGGNAVPPLWDNIPMDLFVEIIPMNFQANVHWHYVLEATEPDADVLRADVVGRARELRGELAEGLGGGEPDAP